MPQINIDRNIESSRLEIFCSRAFTLNITTLAFRFLREKPVCWLMVTLFIWSHPLLVDVCAEPAQRQSAPQPENLPKSEVIARDAFQLLVGPKPDYAVTPESMKSTRIKKTDSAIPWSQVISGSTLDDEIKSILPRLKKIVATKTFFESHISEAIDEFQLLAVCFGIVSAYDKSADVRSSWKKNATGYRKWFERSAYRCQREGGSAFTTARTTVGELENLIFGEIGNIKNDETKPFQWSQVCDRSLLMRRLKIADERLISGTASEDIFSDSVDQLFHATEIVASFGELLVQPEFVDWDDSDYVSYAQKMKEHALEARIAVIKGNYDSARNAAKAISQTCSACHADYR